jgi:glycosyl-4,4'-diaponeurosporenoate acyltransferase
VLFDIMANTCGWAAIQLGLVVIGNRIPHQLFTTRARNRERERRMYDFVRIRLWKDKLPDAGSWFSSGFSKRKLQGRSVAELRRFACETRRGEVVHWCAIGALPIFALWNTPAGMLVNAAYVVAANLPCIMVQRYNQARITHLLKTLTGGRSQPCVASSLR